MEIALSENLSTNDKLCVADSKNHLELPASKMIILDTNILLPAVLPRENRRPTILVDFEEQYHKSISNKPYWRSSEFRRGEKRIEVVNAIEDGTFQKHGLYPGFTDSVYGELRHFDGRFQTRNIEKWKDELKDRTYLVFTPAENLRINKTLSETNLKNSDLSVFVASYILGCNFATDDYGSFDTGCTNRLKNAYQERWGSRSKFVRHDTDSLLMLLRKG